MSVLLETVQFLLLIGIIFGPVIGMIIREIRKEGDAKDE